jgi:hypothetical protein
MAKKSTSQSNIEASEQASQAPNPSTEPEKKKPSAFSQALKAIRDNDEKTLKTVVRQRVIEILEDNGLQDYLTLALVDEVDSISDFHSDRIYAGALNLALANLNGAQERALRRLKRQAGEFLYGHG